MKLPISKKYIYMAAFVVSIVSILQAYTNAQHHPEQQFFLLHALTFWATNYLLWAFLADILFKAFTTINLFYSRRARWFTLHLVSLTFFSFFHFLITSIIYSALIALVTGYNFFISTWKTLSFVTTSIVSHSVDYVLIMVFFWILELYRKYHAEQSALRDVEEELKSAQLSALRYQLNPHFLYNTLNTIASFMGKNGKGQEVIATLGNLLRAMLREDDDQLIPLKQELDYVRDYLKIEKFRFDDRLEIIFSFDEDLMRYKVPPLILQPLVENAIKHGFQDARKIGHIIIKGSKEASQLYLSVQDNGPGQVNAKSTLSGIGIRNVKNRLEKLFPGQSGVEIATSDESGFRIELRLPLITDE
ncbi:MAG: histidine kinase [Cyclobacteriaceae bacterium]